MDTIEYTYTFGMSESELRAHLEDGDVGVLALANEGAAYGIPVADDFDDGLYVRLTREDSSKRATSRRRRRRVSCCTASSRRTGRGA
ncbi:hypothetical protein [Natrononativus amylolyticus]|uniref:hypothetical protein n=1 Tax=Natrononativus amylolyticus TaxID=2963434 RepID=UPI0020CC337B|nr:hypothetical protein [Natrononativus amylolyticus]